MGIPIFIHLNDFSFSVLLMMLMDFNVFVVGCGNPGGRRLFVPVLAILKLIAVAWEYLFLSRLLYRFVWFVSD